MTFDVPDAFRYDSAEHTIRHEYHHVYFDRTSPWAPLWLREGLAEMWAPGAPDGKTIEIGRIDPFAVRRLRQRREPLLPLSLLMKIDTQSPEYRTHDRARVFYMESTLLTHFLLFEEPDGETKLRRFGAALLKGATSEDAAAQVFGDFPALEKRFRNYALKREKFSYARGHLNGEPPLEITFRSMSTAEYVAARAELRLNGKHLELAKKGFEEALKSSPDLSIALEGMGEVALRERHVVEAQEWFRKAAARPDARFSAFWGLARTSTPTKDRNDILEALDHTLALAPRFARALAARAVVIADKEPAEAIRLVESAATLEPNDPLFELRVARVLRMTGNPVEAQAHAQLGGTQALALSNAEEIAAICRRGSQAGFAEELAAACTRAVDLNPLSTQAKFARAVNRIIRHDLDGALEDLRAGEIRAFGDEDELYKSTIVAVEKLKTGDARTTLTFESSPDDPFW